MEEKKEIKNYYELNKEDRLIKAKVYYQRKKELSLEERKAIKQAKIIENAEKYHAKREEQFNCACGGRYRQRHQGMHNTSQRHRTYLLTTEQSQEKINI